MKEYNETLEKLIEKLHQGIELSNKINNVNQGFIGLIVRDASIGNIDIMHNCYCEDDLIHLLSITVEQLKKISSNEPVNF